MGLAGREDESHGPSKAVSDHAGFGPIPTPRAPQRFRVFGRSGLANPLLVLRLGRELLGLEVVLDRRPVEPVLFKPIGREVR